MKIKVSSLQPWRWRDLSNQDVYCLTLTYQKQVIGTTALFGKVYGTIFQSKRRRLVFKTGVILYIQKDTYKHYSKVFKGICLLFIVYNKYML